MATATVTSNAGVNINHGGSNYLTSFPDLFNSSTLNVGYFHTGYSNADQYGLAANWELGTLGYTGGAALLATGDLTYNTSTHVLSGELDSLSFGQELDGVTISGLGTTSSTMSLGSTDFTLSNLGLDSANGDDVHGILYGIMNGDETGLLNYLATHSVTFTGGSGADAYQGGSQADVLNGGGGADTLSGGGGADTINGGAGVDLLTGATGNDIFVFTSVSHSTFANYDTISDFGTGTDKIDLTAITDFWAGFGGTTATGEGYWYATSGGNTFVYGDTDGNTANIEFAIRLTGTHALTASDFV